MKLLIAVLLAAVASCTMYAEDDNQLSVAPITPQASFWRFRNVNAYLMDKGVRIRGHLTASQLFGLPSGHVDVAAYSPDEELIVDSREELLVRILNVYLLEDVGNPVVLERFWVEYRFHFAFIRFVNVRLALCHVVVFPGSG